MFGNTVVEFGVPGGICILLCISNKLVECTTLIKVVELGTPRSVEPVRKMWYLGTSMAANDVVVLVVATG